MCNKRDNVGGVENKAAAWVFEHAGHMVVDTCFDDACGCSCGSVAVLNLVQILWPEVEETKNMGPRPNAAPR